MRSLSTTLAAGVLFFIVGLLLGCNVEPPNVNSKSDIDRLDKTTPSLWARGLSDDQIASLARLKELQHLDFSAGRITIPPKITDRGLAELAKLDLPKLDSLLLNWCDSITDAGLENVAKLKHLDWLGLAGCPGITDAGLPKLNASKSLTRLDLRGCPYITDNGIQQLGAKTDWKEIHLGGCPKITPAGVASLQAALPNTRVVKNDTEWEWTNRID